MAVVGASPHHHRHGHGVAQHQGLLFGIQLGQHRSQALAPRHPGKDGVDVLVVVEQGGDAGANLGHHLVINAGGALIHHQQGDKVLAHFPGNGAKDGLAGGGGVKEAVGLFDGDHQLPGPVQGVFGLQKAIGLVHVAGVDAAGNHIGGQHIGQHGGLGTKLDHHMVAPIQGRQDFSQVVGLAGGAQVLEVRQAGELTLQGHNRRLTAHLSFTKLLDLLVAEGEQTVNPALAKLIAQNDGILQTGFRQVKLPPHQGQILHLDLVKADE